MPVSGLVFVTSNEGKLREARRLLGAELKAESLDLPEIQSQSFEEVVRAKALEAARRLGVPVLVEDSGLEVPAWGGFPGPFTKWITMGALGQAGLARMLDSFDDRRATAVSAFALARPGGRAVDVLVAVGRVDGRIAEAPRGSNGFGWDVLFIPEGDTRTYAEMSGEEKDRDSHRARAFAALRKLLQEQDPRENPA
jgi:non-canonical purine NTP pyrophosphatase (RdgB/HAM1 family)